MGASLCGVLIRMFALTLVSHKRRGIRRGCWPRRPSQWRGIVQTVNLKGQIATPNELNYK